MAESFLLFEESVHGFVTLGKFLLFLVVLGHDVLALSQDGLQLLVSLLCIGGVLVGVLLDIVLKGFLLHRSDLGNFLLLSSCRFNILLVVLEC